VVESELQCVTAPAFLKELLQDQKNENVLCADRKIETLKSLGRGRRVAFLETVMVGFFFVVVVFLKKEGNLMHLRLIAMALSCICHPV